MMITTLVVFLSGLDPCSADFGVLPPHCTARPDNFLMQEGLYLCFGDIIEVGNARTSDGNSFVKDLLSH